MFAAPAKKITTSSKVPPRSVTKTPMKAKAIAKPKTPAPTKTKKSLQSPSKLSIKTPASSSQRHSSGEDTASSTRMGLRSRSSPSKKLVEKVPRSSKVKEPEAVEPLPVTAVPVEFTVEEASLPAPSADSQDAKIEEASLLAPSMNLLAINVDGSVYGGGHYAKDCKESCIIGDLRSSVASLDASVAALESSVAANSLSQGKEASEGPASDEVPDLEADPGDTSGNQNFLFLPFHLFTPQIPLKSWLMTSILPGLMSSILPGLMFRRREASLQVIFTLDLCQNCYLTKLY